MKKSVNWDGNYHLHTRKLNKKICHILMNINTGSTDGTSDHARQKKR